MYWILIYIVLNSSGLQAYPVAGFPSMEECFKGREMLQQQAAPGSMSFRINEQAVCVRTNIGVQ